MSHIPPLDLDSPRTLLRPNSDAQHIVDEVTAFLRSCDHIDAHRCADGLETFALAVFVRDEILDHGVLHHSQLLAHSAVGSWADVFSLVVSSASSSPERWLLQPDSSWTTSGPPVPSSSSTSSAPQRQTTAPVKAPPQPAPPPQRPRRSSWRSSVRRYGFFHSQWRGTAQGKRQPIACLYEPNENRRKSSSASD